MGGGERPHGGSIVEELKANRAKVVEAPGLRSAVSLWADLRFIFRLRRLINEINPDVLHTHCSKAGALARIAYKRGSVSLLVHHVHGWSFRPTQGRLKRTTFRLIERILALRTDLFIFVSHRDRAVAQELGIKAKNGSKVVYNRLDSQMINRTNVGRTPSQPELKLAWVGRFDQVKQPEHAVEVLKKLRERGLLASLVMFGDGPQVNSVRAKIRDYHLEEHVSLMGLKSNPIRDLPSDTALVITSRTEGIPWVVLEAIDNSVRVFSYDVGGIFEMALRYPEVQVSEPDPESMVLALMNYWTTTESAISQGKSMGQEVRAIYVDGLDSCRKL